MAFRTWKVGGPYGERTAWTWPQAIDMICQDIKTAALAAGLTETAAEESAWGAVRHLEEREPVTVEIHGQTFSIARPAPLTAASVKDWESFL